MDLFEIIGLVFKILSYVVLADVIVSWVLDPFHPVRSFLDSIVQPMLEPIRRMLPPVTGIDFSPFLLLLLLTIVQSLVLRILASVL
ncbi:MAG: YggT family protein [Chloroflexi bacterium]|nr:MAG: YggT family protein [Chloroflexota bacterium]